MGRVPGSRGGRRKTKANGLRGFRRRFSRDARASPGARVAKRRRAFAVFAKRKTRILVGGEGRRRELRRPRGFRRRVFTRRRVFETRRRRRRRRRRDDDEDEDEDDVRGGRRRDVSFLRLDLGRRRRVHARRRAERADDDAARARRRRRRGPPRVGRSRRARPRATHGDGDSRNEKVPERLFWGKKRVGVLGRPRRGRVRRVSRVCAPRRMPAPAFALRPTRRGVPGGVLRHA